MSELTKALTKAQVAFPTIPKTKTAKVKTKTGADFSYSYADLADVLDAVRQPLADNGLAITQPMALVDGQVVVVTRLLHESGESIESTMPLFSYDTPQQMGSALTYARRYALCALLGVTAEEDDDAQAGNQPKKPAKGAPRKSEGTQSTSKEPTSASSVPSDDRGKKLGHLSQLCTSRGVKITDELGGPASGASDEAIEDAIRRVQQMPEAEKAS